MSILIRWTPPRHPLPGYAPARILQKQIRYRDSHCLMLVRQDTNDGRSWYSPKGLVWGERYTILLPRDRTIRHCELHALDAGSCSAAGRRGSTRRDRHVESRMRVVMGCNVFAVHGVMGILPCYARTECATEPEQQSNVSGCREHHEHRWQDILPAITTV